MTEAASPAQRSQPITFFLVLLLVAVPVWLLGGRLGVLSDLRIPASDLVLAFAPMLVALGLNAFSEGWASAGALLRRAATPRTLPRNRWLAATLLIPPLIYGAAFALMHLFGSTAAAPAPSIARLVPLLFLFFALAAGEEIGWMGYAFGPLQRRWGALGASFTIAVPWWFGHLPSMAAIGATTADMAWWVLGAAALRIVIAWLYNRTGANLFAVILFHALLNLSRVAIFPAAGPHYLTEYQAAADLVIAAIAVAVVAATRGRLGSTAPTTSR